MLSRIDFQVLRIISELWWLNARGHSVELEKSGFLIELAKTLIRIVLDKIVVPFIYINYR